MLEIKYTCESCNHLVVAPIECVIEEFKDKLQVLSFCPYCGAFNYPLIPKK